MEFVNKPTIEYKDITESTNKSLNLQDYPYSTIGCYYSGQYLGYIGWSSENEQYMFFPYGAQQLMFTYDILYDIADQISILMKDRILN